MSVTITARPDQEIDTNYDSRWLAINGPYPVNFTFSRKDYTLAQIDEDAVGFSELTIATASGNITSQLAVGQTIFFLSADMGEITTTINGFTFNGTNTLIQTEHQYTESTADTDSGNYCNLTGARDDYKLYIQAHGTGTGALLFTGVYTPKPNGELEFDVSGAISPHVNLDLSTVFPSVSQANTTSTEPFYLKYSEYYNGNLLGYIVDSKLYRGVNAANQLQDPYDVNLGDRVAFNADITPKAKWLTAFDSPRHWPGYPFKMSFILEAKGTQPGVDRHEETFDDQGVSITASNTAFAASNQWDYIQEVGLEGSYTASECEVDLWIETDATGNPCTDYLTLPNSTKWVLQDWIVTSTGGLTGVYVIPNPLSGATAITVYPNGVIKDSAGSTVATISWDSTLGYYTPTTSLVLSDGGFYQASIDPGLTVTVWASSCTGIFRQGFVWRSADAADAAYEDEAYTTGYS